MCQRYNCWSVEFLKAVLYLPVLLILWPVLEALNWKILLSAEYSTFFSSLLCFFLLSYSCSYSLQMCGTCFQAFLLRPFHWSYYIACFNPLPCIHSMYIVVQVSFLALKVFLGTSLCILWLWTLRHDSPNEGSSVEWFPLELSVCLFTKFAKNAQNMDTLSA